MNITINGTPQTVPTNSTIEQVLQTLHIERQGIAIASQNRVIAQKDWANYQLSENEALTIIRATCGG